MAEPYYADATVTVYAGDCLDVLSTLPDNSVDAVVTDPPYSLGFMSAIWDTHATPTDFQDWCTIWAMRCLRILKPGGHLLAFGGTRTWHRLAVAIEDAGFEIRDSIAWLYGSGFPKSLDVSKAIDRQRDDRDQILQVTTWLKAQAVERGFSRSEIDQHMGTSDMAGWWLSDLRHRCQCPTWEQWDILKRFMGLPDDMDAEVWRLNGRKGQPGEAWDQREIVGTIRNNQPGGTSAFAQGGIGAYQRGDTRERDIRGGPATDAAQQWQGWGTALKPAHEPIVVARKPLGGVIRSVCGHCQGEDDEFRRNCDQCGGAGYVTRRVGPQVAANVLAHGTGALNIDAARIGTDWSDRPDSWKRSGHRSPDSVDDGVIYHEGVGGQGIKTHALGRWPANVALDETAAGALDHMSGEQRDGVAVHRNHAPSTEQAANGIYGSRLRDSSPDQTYGSVGGASRFFYTAKAGSDERITHDGVAHPTVKPLDLMRWLVRLVTPPGGTILEPFAGSGTTVEAALLEGFRCIAIELEPDYLPLITQRINRRRDPVKYLAAAGEDLGIFDFEEPA